MAESMNSNRIYGIMLTMCLLMMGTMSLYAIDYTSLHRRWGDATVKQLCNKGFEYIKEEQMDSALAFFSIAMGKYDKTMDMPTKRNCVIAMNNAGYIYLFVRQDALQAYSVLVRALDICDENGIEDLKAAIYDNLAKIYYDYNDIEKGIEIIKNSYHIATESKSYYVVLMSVLDMVTMAVNSNQLDSIAPEMQHFKRFQMPMRPMYRYSKALCDAVIDMQHGRYATASDKLIKCRALIDSDVDKNRYQANHDIITSIALKNSGQRADAFLLLEKVRQRVIDNNCSDLLVNVYARMQELSREEKNGTMTDYYELQGLRIKDSLYNAYRYGCIKDVIRAHEMNSLNAKAKAAEEKQKRQLIVICAVTLCLLVVATLLISVVRKSRRLTESNKHLYGKNLELMELQDKDRKQRLEYEKQLQQLSANADGEPTETLQCNKYQNSSVNEEQKNLLSKMITEWMESHDDIFNVNFSLEELAKQLDSKPKYISQVINENFGKNFSLFLGEYRIREACRRLNDSSAYGNLTMEAISESVGYKSRTHFSLIFKKITGLTPTEFVKISKAES